MSTVASQFRSDAPVLPRAVVVMGVTGCGKSTIGQALADATGMRFVDGDALHSVASVEKMRSGVPLTDEDRWPWFDRIAATLASDDASGTVIGCSALKRVYRSYLRDRVPGLWFVHLALTPETVAERLAARKGHFMSPTLIASQFQTLELPEREDRVVTLAATLPVDQIVAASLAAFGKKENA